MNDKQLTAIRARCEAATPGPWRENEFTGSEDIHQVVPSNPSVLFEHGAICDIIPSKADTRFIASARSDVPALLDEIDRLQAKVRELDDCLHPRYHEDLEQYYAVEEKDSVGLAPGYIVCPNKWSHTYHYCTQTDHKDIVSSLCEVGGKIVPMTGELAHWSCSQAYQPIWVATPPKGRRLCKACQRKAEAVKDGDA